MNGATPAPGAGNIPVRSVLTVGLVAFGGFSALAATSDSATTLIVARGLMGIGDAAIFPRLPRSPPWRTDRWPGCQPTRLR